LTVVAVVLLVVGSSGCGGGSGGEPAAETDTVMLTCGEGLPFPSRALHGPEGAEKGSGPEAAVLRRIIAERGSSGEDSIATTGWRVLADNRYGVFYGSGQPPRMSMATVWREHGELDSGPAGSCLVHRYRAGYEAARWRVTDGDERPSEHLTFDVTEAGCASGEAPGPRLRPAEVEETDDSVIVTFWVRTQTGGQTCQGNPHTTVTVDLAAALGDRVVLDGGPYPPAPVHADGSIASSTTTTTGPPPSDAAAARKAIDAAFHTAFDADIPDAVALESVENGANLRDVSRTAAKKHPDRAATTAVTVRSVRFIDRTHAEVRYDLRYRGTTEPDALEGSAVRVNGRWKVSHQTRCDVIVQADLACPAG
jgi:hypothetical protein